MTEPDVVDRVGDEVIFVDIDEYGGCHFYNDALLGQERPVVSLSPQFMMDLNDAWRRVIG